MLYCVSTACCRPHPPAVALERLAAIGVRRFELAQPLDEAGQPRAWTPEEVDACAGALARTGGELVALHTEADFLEDAPHAAAERGSWAVFAALGARWLIVPGGRAAAPLDETEVVQYRELAQAAAAHGLRLALETGPGWCSDYRNMQTAIRALGEPGAVIDFDPARYQLLNEYSDGEVATQRIWGLIGSLRLRDTDGDRKRVDLPPPGQGGRVDFARFWQIVGGLRFAGPVVLDIRRRSRRTSGAANGPTAMASPSLDALLQDVVEGTAFLRQCGWQIEPLGAGS